MKQQAGIALLTILIFMQIWALLSLFALETAGLATKITFGKWRSLQLHMSQKNLLTKLEPQIVDLQSKCLIDQISAYELLSKPLKWWQGKSNCHTSLSSTEFYYVIEHLGVDPCGYLQLKPKRLLPEYLRMSVLQVAKGQSISLLQSTVVHSVPDDGIFTCLGKNHFVFKGQQMQRHLIVDKFLRAE